MNKSISMRRTLPLLLALGLLSSASTSSAAAEGSLAPDFTQTEAKAWINSAPLSIKSLRGQVVLIDFWTFECWNCYRSFPWLNAVEAKYRGKGLSVVGVHTPEFEREKVIASIRDKVRQFDIRYPVMIDSDHAYWNALRNSYWPAFYLIDKEGHVRAVFAGETHAGDPQARNIEAAIEELLKS